MSWTRWTVGTLVVGAAVGAASRAEAKEGFEIGGRLGYAIPMGKTQDDPDADVSDTLSGMIPLQLDIGYRVIPALMVGGYAQYGFGIVGGRLGDLCDASSADCGAHDVRLGVQLQYHLSPSEQIDPWLGAGIGYEWLTYTTSGGGTDVSTTGHGFEFLMLQGGVDFPVGDGYGIGPFVSFSLGQFGSYSQSCDGQCLGFSGQSGDIDKKALHEWLTLGVRGTFVL